MRKKWHWGLLILAFILLGLPAFSAGQGKAPAETPKAAAPAAQAEKMPFFSHAIPPFHFH